MAALRSPRPWGYGIPMSVGMARGMPKGDAVAYPTVTELPAGTDVRAEGRTSFSGETTSYWHIYQDGTTASACGPSR